MVSACILSNSAPFCTFVAVFHFVNPFLSNRCIQTHPTMHATSSVQEGVTCVTFYVDKRCKIKMAAAYILGNEGHFWVKMLQYFKFKFTFDKQSTKTHHTT